MKDFTVDDLKKVVETLTENDQTTTNLDIKQALRKEDFWATQDIVSNMMMANYADLELDYDDGAFRTYFKIDVNAISNGLNSTGLGKIGTSSDDDADPVKQNDVDYIKQDGSHVISTKQPIQGDWQVGTIRNPTIASFDSAFTRDEVRQAIAAFVPTHFHNTRTSIIK